MRKKREQGEGQETIAGSSTTGPPGAPTVRLTPVDVQQKEFRLAVRGYNEREVDEFLDEVTEEMARLYAENKRLREQFESHGTARMATSAAAPGGPLPATGTLGPFLAREKDFLQNLAGLIQGHAQAVKDGARRVRDEAAPSGHLIDLADDEPAKTAAFETTGAASGEEDRSVRELFWGED